MDPRVHMNFEPLSRTKDDVSSLATIILQISGREADYGAWLGVYVE